MRIPTWAWTWNLALGIGRLALILGMMDFGLGNWDYIRVSRKTVYAFWFLISRHSEGPESNSWTFFYSPFNADFKNVLDFVILPIFDWVIAKLVSDAKNKNQHFWNIIGPKITVKDHMCWLILEPFNRINTK